MSKARTIKGTMGGSEAVKVLAMSVERRVRKADWRVAMRTLESMIGWRS